MVDPQRILVVQPSWVGDAVLASPTLRALRQLYPEAHIACLLRRYVKPIFMGMPWWDRLITYRTGKTKAKAHKGLFDLAGRVRAGNFDLAVLLPNSFKSALICKMARIKRIVGYGRDGRGFLLTDRLLPAKERGKYIPTPIVRYYLGLAQYLGARNPDTQLELFVTAAERQRAREILMNGGLDADICRPGASGEPPLVVLNPGAQYGDAKCWLPENFAALADRFIDELGATVLISSSPRERRIVEAVQRNMKHAAIDLSNKGLELGSLKEIVRRCDLMVTNDTGPRHIAIAFGIPVVTIFGPTHSQWTETDFPLERKVSANCFCGPCQKKRCPLDHRCMTRVSPAAVFSAAASRMRDLNAFSSILSPSPMSIARLILPSRLALKRPEGSFSKAPLAKVNFTTAL
jgi:heptosyltransferase-2